MQTQDRLTAVAEPFATGATVSRRESVIACNVMEETVLLDLNSGVYFGLDPVGTRIWAMLGSPRRVSDLRDDLLQEFEIDSSTCEKSVCQFMNELAAKGLVNVIEG
jgi:hypothetical protein